MLASLLHHSWQGNVVGLIIVVPGQGIDVDLREEIGMTVRSGFVGSIDHSGLGEGLFLPPGSVGGKQ